MTDILPITSDELADLKAKAKAATPGPWYYVRHSDHHFINGERYSVGVCYGQTEEVVANAALITGANPETILRLIDMIERRDAWQPIETAPKDGRALLLYQEGQINVGYWRRDSKVGPVWCTFDATALYRASHWQPLPTPPSEALAATEPGP